MGPSVVIRYITTDALNFATTTSYKIMQQPPRLLCELDSLTFLAASSSSSRSCGLTVICTQFLPVVLKR